MKKIIGLSCGRKNGNSETFLKAALMGAGELGMGSEIIRVHDLKVLPCMACRACWKNGKCLKDDVDWILEQTMLANEDTGVIVSAPVYHIRSNGYMYIISEKMNHLFRRKSDLFDMKRVGAAISVGGSGYDGWTSLGLTTINLFLQHFSKLVDQIQINHCADMGAALTPDNQWAIDRSRQLGRNVAQAMSMPIESVKYVGEETAVSCPVCHCSILYIENDFPEVTCPTCQVHGKLSYVDGKYEVHWNMEDVKSPRFSAPKQNHHAEWVARHRNEEEPQIAMAETQEKIKAYKAYGKYVRPEKSKKIDGIKTK